MIIGLTGDKEAGKDTVAAYLIKKHKYERRAFADPLKKHVAGTLNIPFSIIDKWKLDDNIRVVVEDRRSPSKHDVDMSFREFLQRDGTEGHREVPEMGFDFWVDLTLPHSGYYVNRNIAISDCRFDNEAQRIRSIGGKVVEIVRPGTDKKDQHRSEAGVSPDLIDYMIFNNSTLEDLETRVEIMLERLNVS